MKTLFYETYFDKVYGGWAGKCIGGTVGWFEGTKRLTQLAPEDVIPQGMVANDDLDVQLVWVDVLLEKGLSFTSADLMRAWVEQYDYNFGEYGYSRRNFLRGIEPPVSGWYANDYYVTGMGCPIRAEIWGMLCPGDADAAAALARRDGELDHRGESVWAEQFIAGMVAEAFFESDLRALIRRNLRFFPEGSLSGRCVRAAMALLDGGLGWREAWQALRDDFGHPDCTYTPFNMGILALALLCGGGDVDQTLQITINAGWDVDCTCSTACALLGVIGGHAALPAKWLELIGEELVTLARVRAQLPTVRALAETTCALGAEALALGMADTCGEGFPAVPVRAIATAPLRVEADYLGDPVIRPGETKRMALHVANAGPPVQASLALTLPDGFAAEWPTALALPQGESRIDFSVTLDARVPQISDANRIEAALAAGTETASVRFGLCGAPGVLVSRPVFDSYMDWVDMAALPERRILKSGGARVPIPELGEEWGNHRVDIDKPYMDEDFCATGGRDAILALGGARAGEAVADVYRISDHFGMRGPCVCYMAQRVFSPVLREVSAFVGSDCPYKLWINGQLLHAQRENRFWYPNNDVLPLTLNEGWNDVVLKIARTGADNRLTLAFREKQVLTGYDSPPFVVDLRYENMRCV